MTDRGVRSTACYGSAVHRAAIEERRRPARGAAPVGALVAAGWQAQEGAEPGQALGRRRRLIRLLRSGRVQRQHVGRNVLQHAALQEVCLREALRSARPKRKAERLPPRFFYQNSSWVRCSIADRSSVACMDAGKYG